MSIPAAYESRCLWCDETIYPIEREGGDGEWMHEDCAEEAAAE